MGVTAHLQDEGEGVQQEETEQTHRNYDSMEVSIRRNIYMNY